MSVQNDQPKCNPGDMQYAQKLTDSWLLFCAMHITTDRVRILNQHSKDNLFLNVTSETPVEW